jgi:hypothetical protein
MQKRLWSNAERNSTGMIQRPTPKPRVGTHPKNQTNLKRKRPAECIDLTKDSDEEVQGYLTSQASLFMLPSDGCSLVLKEPSFFSLTQKRKVVDSTDEEDNYANAYASLDHGFDNVSP